MTARFFHRHGARVLSGAVAFATLSASTLFAAPSLEDLRERMREKIAYRRERQRQLQGGPVSRPAPSDATLATLSSAGRTYLVGPRDVLSVSVFTKEEGETENQEPLRVPVTHAGFIAVPLAGRLEAAGRTTSEIEAELRQRYARLFKDPHVSVAMDSYRAKRAFVMGQVMEDGPVYLEHEATSLFEVITRAGGFSDATGDPLQGADVYNVIVQRGSEKVFVDFYGTITDRASAKSFLVEDGDVIFVPKPLNRFRVLGGVNAAGEFELKPGTTLLDGIALAGSFTTRSRRDRVRILSAGEDGAAGSVRNVDATRIFHGKEPDIPLKSGDVIYVSEW